MPRDFDLSPYFEVVKFNVISPGGFDYASIEWHEGDDPPARDEAPAGPPDDRAASA